ncbi:hypothetical protein PR048_002841 [Dryococelus australis]|uniref:Uncharacterized protein n=1 Tax=Dryococelus australis TaxID=614101 RepID=A0ABQ9ILG8_9NEOP|nr:hypothetical protein PR048_002841 [Dryococelus australis]
MEEKCIFCGEGGMVDINSVNMTKGLQTLRNLSVQRRDGIREKLEDVSNARAHAQCRKCYTRHGNHFPVSLPGGINTPKPLLRSDLQPFDFKLCCLYCRETVDMEAYKKHPDRYPKICPSGMCHKNASIPSMCAKSCAKKGEIVLNRISSECDLIAVDAQYHKDCDVRFSIVSFSIPGESSENVVARPVDHPKLEAFNKLCNFLDDNDGCQYLLSDLMEMLLKLGTESDKLYSEKHVRELLSASYGNTVVMSFCMRSLGTVVSFRSVASRILTDNWYASRKKRRCGRKEEGSRRGYHHPKKR